MNHPDKQFIVITPARDEEAYLERVIEAIVGQTVLPAEWVIVDDGSVDQTAEIARFAATKHNWIKVYRRKNRGYRDLGAGVAEAITEGLVQVSVRDYDFIFNIDADIILGPKYFETILKKFEEDPGLGIAVGEVYERINHKILKMRAQPLGMVGALKCWRRTCFEQIGGLARGEGWDGVDCLQAMRFGWRTATFPDEELKVIHLRQCRTSVRSIFYGWMRHGRALHFAGSHPLYVLASALYHSIDRPVIFGSIFLIIGYLEAAVKKSNQFNDREFRRFLRQWQLKRLAEIIKIKCPEK